MRRALPVLIALLLAGCGGWQSANDPGGPVARDLQGLFWLFTITCGLVWIAVMGVLAAALLRRPPGTKEERERADRRSVQVVGGAVAGTVLIVAGLTLASYFATRSIASDNPHELVIRLRGYQWWWEVTYADERPDRVIRTANEIHIPVGRPVRFELGSVDVIHSFWVPNLSGKQDMIPGRNNSIVLTADRPGSWRGQCAEFCGLQHAHMALHVVAEPEEDFERWRSAQLAEASAPATEEEEAGKRVLEGKACAACHTVRGTEAAGTLGPDLTHVAGRRYLAAGMLPTTRGAFAAWIADPQSVKPGNNMPMVPLSADELQSVSAYLARLR